MSQTPLTERPRRLVRRRGERGAAAVEFALILPIFLMLLFGIIDFGYMINRGSMINNAARDAVREASLGGDEVQVRGVATSALDGVPGAVVSVSCAKDDGAPCTFASKATGDRAQVTITYQHDMLTPIGIFVPGGFNLSRTAEMRVE